MAKDRKIAICIPTYNQGVFLSEAVRSCFAQSYCPIEVWVSDDASEDETPLVLRRLKREFLELNGHRQTTNLGMVGNYDWLLRQPSTDFIAMFDADDVAEPRFLERLAHLLEKYPGAGYAHGAIRYVDKHGGFLKESRLARVSEYVGSERALKKMLLGQRANPSFLMFRREALRKVNFFQGRPENVQDYDLLLAITASGFGNAYAQEVVGRYRCWGGPQWSQERSLLRAKGLVHIYERTLEPAFRKRGWNEAPIRRARRRQAASLVGCLREFHNRPSERQGFENWLMRLDSSFATRMRIATVDCMPHGLINYCRESRQACKEWIKRQVRRIGGGRHSF